MPLNQAITSITKKIEEGILKPSSENLAMLEGLIKAVAG
jgi:hypothetical protein